MTNQELTERAQTFYSRLNTVPEAKRFLTMFDRDVEFRLDTEPCFTLAIREGQAGVKAEPADRSGEFMIMRTDADTLAGIMAGQIRYAAAGGGYVGKLQCVDGIGYYPDLSWVGILTRLAQEHR